MNRIYVARHGESTWNAERRWTGHGDPPLNEIGRGQASEACETLSGHRFDAVFFCEQFGCFACGQPGELFGYRGVVQGNLI